MGDTLEHIISLKPVMDSDIPPPHVIEEMNRREREKNKPRYEPVPLDLPLDEPCMPYDRLPGKPDAPTSGVVEIDYAIMKSF